ncbi:hypothetical protein K501DRAFT_208087 [Backusella circina FSU 941]|nr:hypothetical protein K501DRAFT_208087 [Backusella circina FSU 941]
MPSFIYPIEGIVFFLSHPKQLWLKTLAPIVLTLIFSTFSVGLSFKVLLPTLVDKLLEWHWPHWMSWFVSLMTTVLESAILNLIFFAMIVPFFQDQVFDATLRARHMDAIFDEVVEVPRLVRCWRSTRTSLLITWLLLVIKILLMILTAPLQLIPILGTALACYINGWPTAWNQHVHYDLEFRGMRVRESSKLAWDKKWHYANFGSVAFAFEIIPILNIFFVWTNIVGAALWIADDYLEDHKPSGEHAPLLPNDVESSYETI